MLFNTEPIFTIKKDGIIVTYYEKGVESTYVDSFKVRITSKNCFGALLHQGDDDEYYPIPVDYKGILNIPRVWNDVLTHLELINDKKYHCL